MKFNRLAPALFAAALALIAGCGPPKLEKAKSFEVDFFNSAAFGPDLYEKDQTIKVSVSADKPVDVFILLGINEAVAVKMNSVDLREKAAIAKVDVTSTETITVKIPANTQCVVVLYRTKTGPATATVRLSN